MFLFIVTVTEKRRALNIYETMIFCFPLNSVKTGQAIDISFFAPPEYDKKNHSRRKVRLSDADMWCPNLAVVKM